MTRVSNLLWESVARYPDRPAVVEGVRTLTYRQLGAKTARYAQAFARTGVSAGQRAAILMDNSIEFIAAYYAAISLGASVIPVNSMLTQIEIEHVLTDSGAVVIISDGELVPLALAAADSAKIPYLTVRDIDDTEVVKPIELNSTAVDPKSEAVVLYTSGTTGAPKGAVLTHGNLTANAWVSASTTMFGLAETDVILACLPMFHAYAQTCVLNAGILSGSCLVIMRRFEPGAAIALMIAGKVTVFQGVPTMYIGLLEGAGEQVELPKLRLAASGGAALPVAILDEFQTRFGCPVSEGYGLSESSPMACFNQPQFPRRAGTVGRPIWGVDVEIADSDIETQIRLLPSESVGEVVIRGHNVFAGYLNRPEATASTIVDGWLRTGDIGSKDVDGYVTLLDRKKDLIVRGGFNVYPREIEEVMMAHPAIAEVAVIGRPDHKYGEEVVAAVRLYSTVDAPTEVELQDWTKKRLAKYKFPRHIVLLDVLPKGSTGKILKRELKSILIDPVSASSVKQAQPRENHDAGRRI